MADKLYGTVLLRAKDILDLLVNSNSGLTLKEISSELYEPKSTTLKVLTTMLSIGMVRRSVSDKRYFIGSSMISYGDKALADFDIVHVATPYLKELQNLTNETVNLGIEENNRVVVLNKLESTQMVNLNSKVGGSMSMHSSSMGKALLANKDDKQLDTFLKTNELTTVTEKTITNKDELIKELSSIRKNGYATEEGETQQDVVCVGASLVKRNMIFGAFSVSVPAYRMDDDRLEDLKRLVVSTKNQIEAQL